MVTYVVNVLGKGREVANGCKVRMVELGVNAKKVGQVELLRINKMDFAGVICLYLPSYFKSQRQMEAEILK